MQTQRNSLDAAGNHGGTEGVPAKPQKPDVFRLLVHGPVGDAVSALTNLGYSQAQASAAVARVVSKEGDGAETALLIRLGLKELSS